MKRLLFGALTIAILFALPSCAKDAKDNLVEKTQVTSLATSSVVTTNGDVYGCWYTSQLDIGHISSIKNSYIWVIQNMDPKPIDPDPLVNNNNLIFGSDSQPFHSNPASKKISDIRDWIISAITELGGSSSASGQWDCSIDSSNPSQINVTIYNNGSGCGNVETIFPNYDQGHGTGVKTAVFVSFDLVGH